MQRFKEILKILSIPISLLGVFLIVSVVWRLLGWPQGEELIVITQGWFERYGLLIIFISAFIEGVLLLGQYYPGGLVIFLGVISSGGNIERVIAVVSTVSLAFIISYSINWLLGKHGWYTLFLKFGLKETLETAKDKLGKHEFNAIMLSYWEPNLASVTATAAGILHIPFRRFFFHSSIGVIVWNAFWGILVASLGANALKLMGIKWALLVFLFWVAVLLVKHYWWDRRKVNPINIP